MPKLDLIVTHYNESWETGMKFYDMLCLQRGISFSDFRVIIVQDGREGSLEWERLLENYPYAVNVYTINHSGVSVARNAGLEHSDAEWVMFCDFDDTFTGVHSLRKYFECMNDDTDMIYSYINGEEQDEGEFYRLETYMDNDTFIHGKMFRREFLMQSDLRFEPGVTFSEDTLFCHVVNIVLDHNRKREIPEILYTRCWYEDSVCRNYENKFRNAVGIFRARKALCREYYERNCMKNFTGTVVKTAFDYYYAITSGRYPNSEWFEEDFWLFWRQYGEAFELASRDIVMYENDISFHEAVHKGFVMIPNITFWDWLDKIKAKYDANGTAEPDTDTVHERVAVYQGTRNLYSDMNAAMKSLILHSSVQKVYLLIEDDEFPYPVPECVEVINVSNQKYILPSSPNYNMRFTYMAMLRAAFPLIFPQHQTILSLDVDTIVTSNIDDIWNTDITDVYYAAVKETKASELYGYTYTNIGVCLMNLQKMRTDGIADKAIKELNTNEHSWPEQDVFNSLCRGNIITLPSSYNASRYCVRSFNEKIVHFAGFIEKTSPLIERYRIEPWPDSITLKLGTASPLVVVEKESEVKQHGKSRRVSRKR